MESIQEQIKATLLKSRIPVKEVEVYGSQIVITAWSREAANKWASLVSKFAKLRGVVETMDYNKVNENTVLIPSAHKVWRVFGVMA